MFCFGQDTEKILKVLKDILEDFALLRFGSAGDKLSPSQRFMLLLAMSG